MEHWFVERNRRDLNWLQSVHVRQPNGEVKEYKLPYACDKCSTSATYGHQGQLFCIPHWLEYDEQRNPGSL